MANENTERGGAQKEVARWGFRVGHNLKLEDGSVCERCHHKRLPHHKGHADNIIDWRQGDFALALRIEVKACHATASDPHGGHFPFYNISDVQYEWMKRWIDRTGAPAQAWLWLQMGVERVNSPSPFKRQVFLVNWGAFLKVRETLTAVGVDNLPLHALSAQTRVATREGNLYAENLLSEWSMQYQGEQDWWPGPSHPIWTLLRTEFYDFQHAIDRAGQYPRPD